MSIGTFNENHHASCNCRIDRNTSLSKSRVYAIFCRPKQFPPVNSFPRSSIDHFCPRRSTWQLRRHPVSTEKRFYGRRTPIHPSSLVRQPPSTGFSLQVANFKNSDGFFSAARESICFRCPLRVTCYVNRLTLSV